MTTSQVRKDESAGAEAGDAVESLKLADTHMHDGRWREAIDLLNRTNRLRRDARIERRLVRLRHDAFDQLRDEARSLAPWPGTPTSTIPSGSPPEIERGELNDDVLRASIFGSGSLLVRGLFRPATVAKLVEGIDHAFAAFDATQAGTLEARDAPWFEEFEPAPHHLHLAPGVRRFVRSGGGVFAADSPPVLFDLLDAVEEAGVTDVVRGYFGEDPALSLKKTTLRRVTKASTDASWHQDGAFMGTDIRTVNLWLPLTACGKDAPGLEILPRRLDSLVETGTEGAVFDWAASTEKVEEAGEGVRVSRPRFEAGDAYFFDHFFMHRTAADASMTKDRHAIEMWFFAPSMYPSREIPLVV
jgi:hypothetical protein